MSEQRATRIVVQQSCPHGLYELHHQRGFQNDVCTAASVKVVDETPSPGLISHLMLHKETTDEV